MATSLEVDAGQIDDQTQLITREAAATALGVSVRTIDRYIARRWLIKYRLENGGVRVDKRQLPEIDPRINQIQLL